MKTLLSAIFKFYTTKNLFTKNLFVSGRIYFQKITRINATKELTYGRRKWGAGGAARGPPWFFIHGTNIVDRG